MLELLYESEIKNQIYFEGKLNIDSKKCIIQAPWQSGKSSFVIDFASRFPKKEQLFIDLNDFRVDTDTLNKELSFFCKNRLIKLLIIDNYNPSLLLPDVENIVLTTLNPCKIDGFKNITLNPLDFEEFILFEKRHTDIKHIYNRFIICGSLPIMANTDEAVKYRLYNTIIKSWFWDEREFEIFKILCQNQAQKRSNLQIYKQLKTKIAISKDRLYDTFKRFELQKSIFFLQKYNQPRASKKIYLFDFGLKNILFLQKDFSKLLENMIFLELQKRFDEIFYLDNADFYIPQKKIAIISTPFPNKQIVDNKIKKLPHEAIVDKIEVVTTTESIIFTNNPLVEFMPFWEWALGF
jgi:predicted AAA+ superfamily ATPase